MGRGNRIFPVNNVDDFVKVKVLWKFYVLVLPVGVAAWYGLIKKCITNQENCFTIFIKYALSFIKSL